MHEPSERVSERLETKWCHGQHHFRYLRRCHVWADPKLDDCWIMQGIVRSGTGFLYDGLRTFKYLSTISPELFLLIPPWSSFLNKMHSFRVLAVFLLGTGFCSALPPTTYSRNGEDINQRLRRDLGPKLSPGSSITLEGPARWSEYSPPKSKVVVNVKKETDVAATVSISIIRIQHNTNDIGFLLRCQ